MIKFFNLEFEEYEYLLPTKKVINQEHLKKSEVIKTEKDKIIARNYFYSKELFLQEKELEMLEFINLIEKTELNLKKPIFWKKGDYLRLIYLSNFDKQLLLKNLQDNWNFYNNWELNNFIEPEKIILKGGVYALGRDKNYFPNIIIDLNNFYPDNDIMVDDFILALSFILFFIKSFYMLPDYCDKFNIILNIENVGIFFNIKFLKKIINFINIYFNGFLNQLFIININFFLKPILNGLHKFLDNNQISKLKILNKSTDILDFIDKNQLEKKFNGNLQNITNYWPPMDTFKDKNKFKFKELIDNKEDLFYFDSYHYLKINKFEIKISTINNIENKNFSKISTNKEKNSNISKEWLNYNYLMKSYQVNNEINNDNKFEFKRDNKLNKQPENQTKKFENSKLEESYEYLKKSWLNIQESQLSNTTFKNPYFNSSNSEEAEDNSNTSSLLNDIKISSKGSIINSKFKKNSQNFKEENVINYNSKLEEHSIEVNDLNYNIPEQIKMRKHKKIRIFNEKNKNEEIHSFQKKDEYLDYLDKKYGNQNIFEKFYNYLKN